MAESEDKVVDGEGVILNSGYLTQGENQRVAGGETLQFPSKGKKYAVLQNTGPLQFSLQLFKDEKAFLKKEKKNVKPTVYHYTANMQIHSLEMTIGKSKRPQNIIIIVHGSLPRYFKPHKSEDMMKWVKGFQIVSNAISRREEIAGQRSCPDGGEETALAPEVRRGSVTNRENKPKRVPKDSGYQDSISSVDVKDNVSMEDDEATNDQLLDQLIGMGIIPEDNSDEDADDLGWTGSHDIAGQAAGGLKLGIDDATEKQSDQIPPVPAPRVMKTLEEHRQEEVKMRLSKWTAGGDPIVVEKRIPPTVPQKPVDNKGFKAHLNERLSQRKTIPVRPKTLSTDDDKDDDEPVKRKSKEDEAKIEPPYDRPPQSMVAGQGQVVEKEPELKSPSKGAQNIHRDRLNTYPSAGARPVPKVNHDNDWMDPGHMRWEQSCKSLKIYLSKSDLIGNSLALVTIDDVVYIAGWKKDKSELLKRKLHVGDILLQINDMNITSADRAHTFITSSAKEEITLVIKRLPHAAIRELQKDSRESSWGLKMTKNEIKDVSGPALKGGITPKIAGVYSNKQNDWAVTELEHERVPFVNCPKDEVKQRLEKLSNETSIVLVLHPRDFVAELSKAIRHLKQLSQYI